MRYIGLQEQVAYAKSFSCRLVARADGGMGLR